ncbi:MAG TPA: HlyD family efflux transporter periplasmic adaptor subunit [Burkholderiaceae bacterium]|nr:HlyD family efflux transporter periplasmic adaptor subunit [Burkholderiaceae bacterium]
MRHTAPGLFAIAALALPGCSSDKPASYQGYVEGEYVHVASAVGGRLEKLLVQRGQTIGDRAPLFNLEAEAETAAKQQADEQLKAAQAQLADLKLGKRKVELDVAQAQLAQAVAAEEQATQQVNRDEAQFEIGGIARAQLDDSRANQAVKAARVRELAGQVQVSRLPARDEQIRAQDAQVAAARAVSTQASWRLDQKRVFATQGGLVVDTLYREGEWVNAGSPVVRMLPPGHLKVRFFVPQAVAGALKPGRAVRLHCDGCETDISAVVSYIATEPEYTPPVIYSNETRAKLVFMVEARPAADKAQALRPGQPVVATLQ